ncbi:hypothetical protein [Taibaiella soli]|nr:hypothetical protein [Taibaiella soli]
MKRLKHFSLKGMIALSSLLFATESIAQNANSELGANVPLSKAYNTYALVNHWKTYKEKTGYTISLPANISDDGKTQSDIHNYGNFEIGVEIDMYNAGVDMQKKLNEWYKGSLDIGKERTLVSQTLSASDFVIVTKDKDGSTWYTKCIKGSHCLYTLSFGVGNDHPIKERDVEPLLHLFKTIGK